MLTMSEHRPLQRAARVLGVLLILSFVITSLSLTAVQAQAATCSGRTYTVKSGDNLTVIANEFNTTVAALAEANNLKDPYTIYIGQQLCIPGAAKSTATETAKSSSKSSSKKVDFTINDLGKRIEVVVSESPNRAIYYVRVANLARRTLTWEKLGVMRVNKEGEGARSFRLSDDLSDDSRIRVCLKNARTDQVYCKDFYRDISR
jgi:murein DD-endopeptidase MepM/ murein hydrolase activator NlpD